MKAKVGNTDTEFLQRCDFYLFHQGSSLIDTLNELSKLWGIVQILRI